MKPLRDTVRLTLVYLLTFLSSLQASDPFLFLQIHDRSGVSAETPVSSLIGTTIPLETPLILGPRSRAEFANSHFLVRAGGGSEIEILSDAALALSRGAVLIQPRYKNLKIDVSSKKIAFTVAGSGCFVVEATSNGGCKVLSLNDSIEITVKGKGSSKASPGNLLFLVPETTGFGPRLDVDLNVFRLTSALINGYEKPLEGLASIKTAAFKQTFRIKGRTNALIGDAKNSKNYDVLFLK
jgi:hypothetical protein